MVRTFLAIDLPDTQNEIIRRHQAQWKSLKADIRWVSPTNIHLTLKFLGEIEEIRTKDVIAACRDICSRNSAFSLALMGTGTFPGPKRPRVLWIGVGGETGHLYRLQRELELALEERGFPRDERAFSPHLTVGRLRSLHGSLRPIDIFIHDEINSPPFLVSELVVYKSLLFPRGPIYKAMARCPLIVK